MVPPQTGHFHSESDWSVDEDAAAGVVFAKPLIGKLPGPDAGAKT